MKTILRYSLITLILFSLISGQANTSTHTIAPTIELTETAINRFLQNQYNQIDFPRIVTGSIGGVNYTLNLSLPEVILLQEAAKVELTLDVTSSVGSFHVVVQPSLGISSGNISTSQVTAFLVNLPTVVQILPVPQWLKDAIVNEYNSLNLVMYPSKLVNDINSSWLKARSINLVEPNAVCLGWQVSPGVLRIIISTNLSSNIPKFLVRLINATPGDLFGVFSNIEVTIKEFKIVIGSTAHSFSPNQVCEKDDVFYYDVGNLFSGGDLIVRVVYETDNTFYYREYGHVTVNYENWTGETNGNN